MEWWSNGVLCSDGSATVHFLAMDPAPALTPSLSLGERVPGGRVRGFVRFMAAMRVRFFRSKLPLNRHRSADILVGQ